MRFAEPAVLLGAGGHAKVVLSLARACDVHILGVCDPALAREGVTRWRDLDVLGSDGALASFAADKVYLLNGLGYLPGGHRRMELYLRWRASGFRFPALVHPAAWVDTSVELGEGVQVMAGAVVQADCWIGENTIINTRAGIDHDCRVGAHAHVAPGAALCGSVRLGDEAFVGAGATVLPNLELSARAVVGAGLTVSRSMAIGEWLRAQPTHHKRNDT